jgi:signal transduction histidine kinase
MDTPSIELGEPISQAVERQLTLLIEASATLLGSPDSADVLNRLLRLARQLLEADAYTVWRKRSGDEWQIEASEGLSAAYTGKLWDSSQGAPRLLLEPLAIEDVEQAANLKHRVAAYRAEGIRSILLAPLFIRGELAGTIVFYYRTPRRFGAVERRLAAALGNLATAALSTADLYEREIKLRQIAEAERRRAAFLAEAGQVLSSSLDYESTLASVVDLAVPAFADWASVSILDERGRIRPVSLKHVDPSKLELLEEYRRRFPSLENDADRVALRTGESILVEEVPDEALVARAESSEHLDYLRRMELRSIIFAPLVANGRTFGILSFFTGESGRRYTQEDLSFAKELARRAATAMDNARLFAESQAAQEALKRSNEDLNQFAYSASHDLQEPLRIIAIYTELLKRKYSSRFDADAREYMELVVQSARRMDMLLRDLLAYVQAANIGAENAPCIDANEVAENVRANLQAAIAESGATLTWDELPKLRVQESHLVQLLQNLIGNAIKYRSAKPPAIHVSAQQKGNEWKIGVQDNGIGIAPQYREQVFGLFKRLHTQKQFPGTGIGLALCQKIVERYGGRIWVESEEGTGSTFYFTLPG